MRTITPFQSMLSPRLLCAALGWLFLTSPAAAQLGDAAAGQTKSETCVACHGPAGLSASDEFPHIAGQAPGYIAIQLQAYQTGQRENAIMLGMVTALSAQDMADIDAYYSSLPPPAGSITADQAELARAGEVLHRTGDASRGLPACMSCHGPAGAGIPPSYPRLAGQTARYTAEQLHAYRSRTRENNIMSSIAERLTDAQIEQLAVFFSGLN